MNGLVKAARVLRDAVDCLSFPPPVAYVYNPLVYAWPPHRAYLERWGRGRKRVLFMGMNPGPWGMAQVGVPFGEIRYVHDWLGVTGEVAAPTSEHPRRKVDGFACKRSEVSGRRLWGLFADRFGSPGSFFEEHFVANYCPLMFLTDAAGNITPDRLRAAGRARLFDVCDDHLRSVARALEVEWVVGVGTFAAQRARAAVGAGNVRIGSILHPSPASPAANRGWAEAAQSQLRALGIWP